MPRYKFSWENLPQGLLRALRIDLGLAGDVDPALRKLYGARPSETFVQENWTTLLDRWLKADRTARMAVMDQLRARKLGDTTIGVGNSNGQMAYLLSCRNSAALRSVVAEALRAVGETVHATTPQNAKPAGRSKSWQQFVTSLAATLSALQEDQYLIITLKDRQGFVQFAAGGAHGLRGELMSNAYYLDAKDRLSPKAIKSAVSLGWNQPTGESDEVTPENQPDGSPNFYCDWAQPVDFIGASRLAANTLVDVLAVSHPARLQYKAFADDGSTILLPTLGLRLEPATPPTPEPAQPADANRPTAFDATTIQQDLLTVFRELTGNSDLELDSDGDIPLRYDSVMVFVRVFGDPAVVKVFSPVLADATTGPAQINRRW